MHKIPIDNFVVYYIVDTGAFIVTIIRIVYGGMDIKNIVKTETEVEKTTDML